MELYLDKKSFLNSHYCDSRTGQALYKVTTPNPLRPFNRITTISKAIPEGTFDGVEAATALAVYSEAGNIPGPVDEGGEDGDQDTVSNYLSLPSLEKVKVNRFPSAGRI
jgi:hypothetical protein